jgi:hypothetical protein
LFGSTINQNTSEAYFALDTVFVVDRYIYYNEENYFSKLKDSVSECYFDITLKSAYSNSLTNQVAETKKPEVRCYFGASYKNQTHGMYSFVPCREKKNGNVGFERVKIRNSDLEIISNNLNASPKLNPTRNIQVNFDRWEIIRQIVEKQGFLIGVNFSFDVEKCI